ncbi:MAG TPA: diaminopimelate epimerase [Armatimonadaceae bacterium]|nr:diaminopimelate epimerase [Armatimonadaceae bacterium]
MLTLPFVKMQGIGNDFVVADCLVEGAPSPEELQRRSVFLCDRKFGVGADIVICVLPSERCDFLMRMFNPDGSEAEMCGNGIRCFGKYVYDHGHTTRTSITVETPGGDKVLELTVRDGKVTHATVDMGKPGLERADIPMTGDAGRAISQPVDVDGESVALTAVSMGNPHAVYFVPTATEESIDRLGPALEKHPLFPRRTNVHEVEVVSPSEIKVLTFERGAGRTLACGTGACASVVAAHLNGRTGRRVLVHLLGGDLQIDWSDDDHVYMTGPAVEVFTGTISL